MLYEIINQSELIEPQTTAELIINLTGAIPITKVTCTVSNDLSSRSVTAQDNSEVTSITIADLIPNLTYKVTFTNITSTAKSCFIKPFTININAGSQSTTRIIRYPTIYGYRRDTNDSNPATCITYIKDAVGKTSAAMDYTTNTFNYGDWEDFCTNIAKPVMLGTDGTIKEELNPKNLTVLKDGTTASSVTNSSFNGNAMVLFQTSFKWIKRLQIGQYQYVYISDMQVDENYQAYAFTNAKGKIKNSFALGIYHNRTIANSSKVNVSRSISAAAKPTVNLTIANAVSYAQANGNGWDIMSYQQWQYIRDLLVLITKSDNIELTNGFGYQYFTSSGALHNINGADKSGPFYGTKPTTKGYTTSFNLVDFYGNASTLVTGLGFYKNTYRIKNTPPYNIDTTNYEDTKIMPAPINTAVTSYWAKDSILYENNWLPTGDGGSATTYFCDQYKINHAATLPMVAKLGGWFSAGSQLGGIYTSTFDTAYNATPGAMVSSRLSYIDPT